MLTCQPKQGGVTLIELLISLSVVAILVTIAAPSFGEMLKNSVRSSTLNNFWHAIFLARSEAIKRNSIVVLCKRSSNGNCNNTEGNWTEGWMVFDNLDHDQPAQRDADEPVLRIYETSPQISVTSNQRQTFTFRPVTQSTVNGTIVFCDSRGTSAARAIIISHTGRPRQATKDADNHPLSCPTI